jgi:diguanylate cyclase (GGDEF)-like protein
VLFRSRSYDLFARYGGEEFVGLLDAPNWAIALTLTERIRHAVDEAPYRYEDASIPVTCSIGIASSEDTATLEELIKRADEALYSAKHNGRNCVMAYRKAS